jgi:twinkle protein
VPEILTRDDIDFEYYMRETEADQKVRTAGAFVDDVVSFFKPDPLGQKGATLPWKKTHDRIRIRPGEVSAWAGFSGSGKSLLLGNACLGFAQQHQCVAIASFEMRPVATLARMTRQALGTDSPAEAEIRRLHSELDPWILMYDQVGSVRPETVLAVARFCAEKRGAQHFVIDSFMKCGVSEDGPGAHEQQKKFMDSICALARDTGMHIHLVAHSRKLENEFKPPRKFDIKGSSALSDMVDNVIVVWRNKAKEDAIRRGDTSKHGDPDCLLIVDKQRHFEWEGAINLWFSPASLRYTETALTMGYGGMR